MIPCPDAFPVPPTTFALGLGKVRIGALRRLFRPGHDSVYLAYSWYWTVALSWSWPAAHARYLESYIDALRSRGGRFECWHLARPYPRGVIGGTPRLAGAAQVGATGLAVQGLVGNALLTGDMIKVFGELHQVTADVAASPGAAMVVPIVPPRKSTAPTNSPLEHEKVAIQFALTGEPTYTRTAANITAQIEAIET